MRPLPQRLNMKAITVTIVVARASYNMSQGCAVMRILRNNSSCPLYQGSAKRACMPYYNQLRHYSRRSSYSA